MAKRDGISMSVIRRLPRYYRYLSQLAQAGVTRISSKELSEKMGLTASQIRQDLNCFGGFGQQGYGYMVEQLRDEIANILRLHEQQNAIVLGAGNLGQAVAAYVRFETKGFLLTGIFDVDPNLIGTRVHDELEVQDIANLEAFCGETKPVMAVLCVPQQAAEMLVDQLYALGVRNFWNFSHYNITRKYPNAVVESVHLSDSLMTLCYLMGNS